MISATSPLRRIVTSGTRLRRRVLLPLYTGMMTVTAGAAGLMLSIAAFSDFSLPALWPAARYRGR
jgi:hypothetical protein